jgi:hypothetical protein
MSIPAFPWLPGVLLMPLLGSAGTAMAQSPARGGEVLVDALARTAPRLDRKVLSLATRAMSCSLRQSGAAYANATLSVIDYSRPSTEPRLWVFDIPRQRLLFEELVAHGRNTGENMAAKFSNVEGSYMSSLGAFETQESYVGQNGYSLRLRGLEQGFNDQARERAIVIHGAPYVSQQLIDSQGRLGRSLGCPAVRPAIAKSLIDTIRDGSFVFAYYPDKAWLGRSRLLDADCGGEAASVHAAGTPPTIGKRSTPP